MARTVTTKHHSKNLQIKSIHGCYGIHGGGLNDSQNKLLHFMDFLNRQKFSQGQFNESPVVESTSVHDLRTVGNIL